MESSITLTQLILVNAVTIAPVFIVVARGVWYLSQMSQKVDLMWKAYERRAYPFPPYTED